MKRRYVLRLLGGGAAWPLTARAQRSEKIARVGLLITATASGYATRIEALRRIVFRPTSGIPMTRPVGFVLTPERFITIRFENLEVFGALKGKEDDAPGLTSAGAFVALIEAIVDRIADMLEQVEAELKAISVRIFREDDPKRPRRPAREDANLREIMRRLGRGGDLASDIRDSLLGIGRIVPYVTRLGAEWLPEDMKPRLDTLRADIDSLDDYQTHLANKVQLLLDATLGLINIEQNNIIKVLTIVSVVGVPPTLVASMYGMNFKHMPEYDWASGYPYGPALIAVSAIAPLLWFKLRGWL